MPHDPARIVETAAWVKKSRKDVWRDQPFRRTHDLVELTRQCTDLEPALISALHGIGPLTRFAWEFRYPGESEAPSMDQARDWLAKVKQLLRAVEVWLPAGTAL